MIQRRNRYLKVRVTSTEYQTVMARAGEAGINTSEYVRTVLADNQQAINVELLLHKIDAHLPTKNNMDELASNMEADPMLIEVLLLVREIVAERQAQTLARTANRLDLMFPGRKKI